jgi:trigger factor
MTVDTSDIQITTVKDEPGAKNLKVEIPVDRVQAAERAAAAFYAKRARLPGFRKGKAPLGVVRKQYRGEIRERMLQNLIGEGWKLAVEQEKLKPIADPAVRDLQFDDSGPLTFEFWVPVEGARPIDGDLAAVSIATHEEGKAGEPRQYQVVLGEGQAIPDLEEQIARLLPDETTQATVRYPDDFGDQPKRGQSRTVTITLHGVKRRQLPDVDDAFARETGDFESVTALRAAIHEDLEAHAEREADAEVRRQLMDELIGANGLEPPAALVQRVLSAYAQSYGVPDDQLERFTAEFRPLAERQVLRDLIIDAVAERETLQATEEDLDRRIEELARRQSTEPAKLYASLQKAKQLREVERSITEEKVFAYLLDLSTVANA